MTVHFLTNSFTVNCCPGVFSLICTNKWTSNGSNRDCIIAVIWKIIHKINDVDLLSNWNRDEQAIGYSIVQRSIAAVANKCIMYSNTQSIDEITIFMHTNTCWFVFSYVANTLEVACVRFIFILCGFFLTFYGRNEWNTERSLSKRGATNQRTSEYAQV